MHEKLRLLSLGKMSSHSTALPSFVHPVCMQRFRFSIPRAMRPTLLTTDGHGIFNVRTYLVCAVRTMGGGGGHEQVCTRVDTEGHGNCLSPCPAKGSNPGSSVLNSDCLTTEPREQVTVPGGSSR